MDVGNESVYPTGQSGGAEYAPPAVAPEPRRRRRRAETNHWSLSNAGPQVNLMDMILFVYQEFENNQVKNMMPEIDEDIGDL